MKSKNSATNPPEMVSIKESHGMYEVELNLNPVHITDEENGDYWETDYAFFHRYPDVIDIEDVKAHPEKYLGYIDIAQDLQDYYEQQVDKWMDSVVQTRKYTSIHTCASYRGSSIPKFNAEGTAAFEWRDKVYSQLYVYIDDVLCGRKPIPSVEQLISELPTINW